MLNYDHLQVLGYIVGLTVAIIVWFSTIHGLPPRVKTLEDKVSDLEKGQEKQDAYWKIIMDDLKMIKGILLSEHRGKQK
ncbi:MAG: hypothetical protein J6Y25_04500 [Elusimicrobiaceae bacterium]|nr:hypothetical protein [Elusimicrobiaceae bacterium]